MDWSLVAWVKRGGRRKSILALISKSSTPVSANDVKRSLKIAMSQASATLKELTDQKLIICLNPEDKIGKLYKVHKNGEEALRQIT